MGNVTCKIFQTKDGLLIGKEDMRLNILKSLEEIKSKDGSYFAEFFKDTKCNGFPCKTLDNYYSCDVTFMNIKLTISSLQL